MDHRSFSSAFLRYMILIATSSLGREALSFIFLLISLLILSVTFEEWSDLYTLSGYWKCENKYPSFYSKLLTDLGYSDDGLLLKWVNLFLAEFFVSDEKISFKSWSISFLSDFLKLDIFLELPRKICIHSCS